MTDRLKSRKRELPNGYQVGDAKWRAPHDNAAEIISVRFVRQYDITADINPPLIHRELQQHWNDIERGEH